MPSYFRCTLVAAGLVAASLTSATLTSAFAATSGHGDAYAPKDDHGMATKHGGDHGMAAKQGSGHGSHWGYVGRKGPEHWAEISTSNRACSGDQQSPIDLTDARLADVEDIIPFWSVFRPKVKNNGHTIQADATENNVTNFGGQKYKLLQVHWHHQSEHTINGQHAPLEAHFVHKNVKTGELMVLGVMMVAGEHNHELQKVWDVAPKHQGQVMAEQLVNWYALLPQDRTAYRYFGSLTTPPCSEMVNWVVFQQPVMVSPKQIMTFRKIFPRNNRPVQPRGRRFVLKGN